MFGETFEPVRTVKAEGARIMSLKDSSKKMSKTGDEGIALSDNPDTIREKIKKAVTDPAGLENLKLIYRLLADREPTIGENKNAEFKRPRRSRRRVPPPLQAKRAQFASDMGEVENILQKSEAKYDNRRNNS